MANEVEVRVKVVTDGKGLDDVKRLGNDATTAFDGADKAGGRFSTTLKNIGTTAAGFIGAQVFTAGLSKAVEFFGTSTQAASDVNESLSKVNTVFGTSGKAVETFAQGAAKNFGLSKGAALDAAGGFGNMFTQLGVGQGEAAKMSTNILGLAADFASFHNADITEVLEAQSAAFRGEYDSVQKFVPLINAATVEQKALEMSGKASTKELTAQEKALAANALMFEGAGAAVGDFARTSDGMANSQRIAAAEMENLQAKIGEKLIPVSMALTKAKLAVATAVADKLLPAMEAVGRVLGPLISQGWDKLKSVMETLRPIFDEVMASFTTLKAAFDTGETFGGGGIFDFMGKVGAAAHDLWGLLQDAADQVKLFWNALTTGFTEDEGTPIEMVALALRDFISFVANEVIPAVASFVGDFVDAFQEILPKLLPIIEQVGSIFLDLVSLITAIVQRLAPIVEAVIGAIIWIWQNWGDEIMAVITRIWEAIIGIIRGALDIIQGIIRLVTDVINGDWSAAWDDLKQIVDGAWQIITSIISLAWDGIKALFQLGLDGLQALWENKWEILGTLASLAWDAIKALIGLGWDAIKALFNEALDALEALWNNKWEILKTLASLGWEAIKLLFSAAWEAIKQLVSDGWDAVKTLFEVAWEAIKFIVSENWENIKTLFSAAWEAIKALVTENWENLKTIFTEGWEALKATTTEAWENLKQIFTDAWEALKTLVTEAWEAIKTIFTTAFEFLKALVTGDWETIRQMTSDAWEAIKQLLTDAWEAIKTTVTDALEALKTLLSEAWESIKSTISDAWESIKSTVSDAMSSIKSTIEDAMSSLKSTIEDAWNSVKSTVESAMSSIRGTVEDAWNSIKSTVADAAASIKGSLSGLWSGVTDGLAGKVAEARGLINDLIAAYNSIPLVPNLPSIGGPTKLASPVTTASRTTASASRFGNAHGGILGAERGGIHSGWRLVGEHGAELIKLAPGSQVHSNPDTARMLGQGGGGRVEVHLHIAGSVLAERDLAEKIRDMLYAGDFGDLT